MRMLTLIVPMCLVFFLSTRAESGSSGVQEQEIDQVEFAANIQSFNGIDYVLYDDMWIPTRMILGSQKLSVGLWLNGVLPIEFDPNVNAMRQQIFMDACGWWENVSQISCVLRTAEDDFIAVAASNVNNSYVGRIENEQPMNIVSWGTPGIIAHEIGHALGMIHEHQRQDRNSYVRIMFDNIIPEELHNFFIFESTNHSGYDFESVMHYSATAFSRNGQDTIVNARYRGVMGQRQMLSLRDTISAIGMYGADPNDPPPIRVIDFVGRDAARYQGSITRWYGVIVRIVSGPNDAWTERHNLCESTYYLVVSQGWWKMGELA